MKKTNAILLTGIVVSSITTFECFAPRHPKKAPDQMQQVQQLTQSTQPPQPAELTTIKGTQAFKYLRRCIPDSPSSWSLFDWSKQTTILNLLRAKQLKASMAAARTRKEHDLDWAIDECMKNAASSDLAEIFLRCADQDVKINESSLQAVREYSKLELARELGELKKIQDQAFERIKTMKALERLARHMQSLAIKDEDSDVDDYDDQHMFDKTRELQSALAATAPAAPAAAAPTATITAPVPEQKPVTTT